MYNFDVEPRLNVKTVSNVIARLIYKFTNSNELKSNKTLVTKPDVCSNDTGAHDAGTYDSSAHDIGAHRR